jgi:Cdc6-like AAA superfamily ATPase
VDNEERAKKVAQCSRVFCPSAPVNSLALFAGRLKEIRQISQAINSRGRHAVMYGDRGVGKTSLATVMNDLFRDVHGMRIVKVNCSQTDDYRNVWRKAFLVVPQLLEPDHRKGEGAASVEIRLADELDQCQHVGPGEIRLMLQAVSQEEFEIVVVFDEFDKLAAAERALFADTIKDLSDNSVSATLVLVGVASNVVELIAEHASIDRCLAQIFMPPMDRAELQDILNKAMTALGMAMDELASDFIVSLSQGLPHYTHLLGQEATYKAIEAGQLNITLDHVTGAIREALQNTLESIRNNYQKAAEGQRKGTLFPDVLLACALAKVDDAGYFSSTDVREPLRQITGQDYDIPNFSQHLDKFSSDPSRGPVLEKWGTSRRFRFRLRPYIVMKGMLDGKIGGSLLEQLLKSSHDVGRKLFG